MKEAFEKIIKRLKEKREYHLKERARNHWDDSYMCLKHLYEADAFAEAIEIVKEEYKSLTIEEKSLTEKFNDGWIPVSERLPENNKAVLVFTDAGEIDVDYYGVYCKNFIGLKGTSQKALAWQPLPEPYQPKGE